MLIMTYAKSLYLEIRSLLTLVRPGEGMIVGFVVLGATCMMIVVDVESSCEEVLRDLFV